MAYNITNLNGLSEKAKSNVIPTVYSYWNEDDDTVTGASYFEYGGLKVGDQIQVIKGDYTTLTFYRVSAVSAGKATVVLLTALSPDATA